MITLAVGKLGVGKSYSCTKEVWRHILAGRDCYVDWDIDFTKYMAYKEKTLYWSFKKFLKKILRIREVPYGKIYLYHDLEEIYGISNGEIYMDEAHRFLNARLWEKIPPDFIRKMSQSRKYGCNLHFITQHQNMVDVNVRRLCNEVVVYKKFLRFMMYNAYDGAHIEQLDNPERNFKSYAFKLFWFSTRFANSYDTFKIFGKKFPAWIKPAHWSYEIYLQKIKDFSVGHIKKFGAVVLKIFNKKGR